MLERRVRREAAVHDEVRVLELPRLVLDPERLDLPAHVFVRVLLLRVGEPGPGPPLHQQSPVREPRLQEHAGRVTDHRGDLVRLHEGRDEPVHPLVVEERVHWPLPADEQRRVVVADRDVGERLRLLDQRHVRRRVDEPEAEQVVGGVAGLVARIAPGIALQPPAVGARDVDLVALPGELPVRMGQLGPPEPDRPAGLAGHGRVGGDDHDAARHARRGYGRARSHPNTDRVLLQTPAV
jgi:hypothetical protein